jgi:hypothetical protein
MAIRCNICGATTSKRGEAFSDKTLSLHLRKVHQTASNPATSTLEAKAANSLECDICGATTSRRGHPFRSEAEILRHKASRHRENGSSSGAAIHRATGGSNFAIGARVASHRANFCPNCGFNLEVINAAIDLVNRH